MCNEMENNEIQVVCSINYAYLSKIEYNNYLALATIATGSTVIFLIILLYACSSRHE